MNMLSSLLFAISANTDNFVVGLSYGINKIKIGLTSNLLISLITMTGTFLSMSLSKVIVNFIPTSVANIIGGVMLILIGIWTIVKPSLNNIQSVNILENPEKADKDKSLHIDPKESITLALALTINNIGLGIGASITGLNILFTTILTFIFSIIMLIFGYFFGSYYLSKLFSKRAIIISGLLIISLGVFEIFI